MCTEIAFSNGRDPIATVGGPNGGFLGGGQWRLPVSEVNSLIRSGRWSFFVNRPTPTPPDRVAVVAVGTEFIKTETDGDYPNNLYALPEQADDVPIGMPAFPAGLPPAVTPTVFGVASRQQPAYRPLDAQGTVFALPTRDVEVRLEAPFTNELDVRVRGVGLNQAPTGTVRLPDPLDAAGWWSFDSVGYWGAAPATLADMVLERDRTRFQLRVRLPDSVQSSSLVSLLIAHRSLNPACPPARRLSPYANIELRTRGLQVVTGGNGGTGATVPSAGVTQITGWSQDQNDQFTFTGSVSDPLVPVGARVTTVTNVSTDIDARGIQLDRVTHTDSAGATITDAIPFGAGRGAFRGLLVAGGWSVHATNLSAVLLNRGRGLRLDVAWTR